MTSFQVIIVKTEPSVLKKHGAPQIIVTRPVFNCASSVPDYKCDKCKFKTPLLVPFKKHKCHKASVSYHYTYCCEKCSFITCSQLILMRHHSKCRDSSLRRTLMDMTISGRDYQKFLSCRRFLYEMRFMGVEWLKCEHCVYMRRLKGDLRHHLVEVHPDPNTKWLKCDLCLFNVEQVFLLQQHILEEHGTDNTVLLD